MQWAADKLGLQGIEPPIVRWPEPVLFEPDLADRRETEWQAIQELISGRSKQRILLIEGNSGLGKSELLREAARYARSAGVPSALIDLKGGYLNVVEILALLDLELGDSLPRFRAQGERRETIALRKDLRALRRPILLLFDSFEDAADNRKVIDWLNIHLLREIETARGLAVVISGQHVPDKTHTTWRNYARRFALEPFDDLRLWQPWILRKYPELRNTTADLKTVLMLAEGIPAVVTSFCQALAQKVPRS